MTIKWTEDLERELAGRAEQLGLSVEELILRALRWYLQSDRELEAERRVWQQMSLHAWAMVEQSLQTNCVGSMQHPPDEDAGPERAADQHQDGDQ